METKISPNQKVAEVELRYRTNVNPKDRAQVKSSQNAYAIFLESWNKNTIEYFEEFYLIGIFITDNYVIKNIFS